MSKSTYKELQFKVERSLKQNGLSFTFSSGNNISYSFIKSSASNCLKFNDYALLRLSKPAILQKILFVQHSGDSTCNVKNFQIFAGISEDGCEMLLEGNLKSEFESEEFVLRNKISGVMVPCVYIKICPLQYWESCTKFDVSTCVRLYGIDDERIVADGLESHQQHRDKMAARLCLKFLRDSGHLEAFEVVSRSLGVAMEHPLATELYNSLVKHGDYKRVESILEEAFDGGLADEYMAAQPCTPVWREIQPESGSGSRECCWPPSRGGHQLCVDPVGEAVYLLGGWNGVCDLADFWRFDVRTEEWSRISEDTSKQGGPSARSCHKMCIDHVNGKLYTIGKYLEHQKRIPENLKSDFYCYDIRSDEWSRLSEDTSTEGGPPLVFDHQVAVDCDRRVLFVFGGNALISSMASEERPSSQSVGSLFVYDVATNSWNHAGRSDPTLSTRIGHSLLYNPRLKYLFLFSGQWAKHNFNDLQVYDTTNLDAIVHLDHLTIRDFLPVSLVGYTHRSVIDVELNEIHILTGISKESCSSSSSSSDKHRDVKQNALWIYDMRRGTWHCVDRCTGDGKRGALGGLLPLPAPRFAHQFVYDPIRKVHYLFGGNPNHDCISETRLDDLWSLKLKRLEKEKLVRDMRYLVRRSCYEETVHLEATRALEYLQNDLYDSLDRNDPVRLIEFETLPRLLFGSHLLDEEREKTGDQPSRGATDGGIAVSKEIRSVRMRLFEVVSEFLQEEAKQPTTNLVDLVPRRPWDPLCALGDLLS